MGAAAVVVDEFWVLSQQSETAALVMQVLTAAGVMNAAEADKVAAATAQTFKICCKKQ